MLTGVILQGNAEFYEALNGNKPILIGNGLAVEDFVTPAGVSFTAGATGTVAGLAKFTIETLQPASVAVVNIDNAGGNAAANVLIKPAMDAAGIATSIVAVAETATAPDIASAMEAAGAGEADVFILLTTIQGCINAYDSIQSLGIDPVVVTTGLCYGTPMIQHMEDIGAEGDFPDGWYYGGYGYNYFEPDLESGVATYVAKVFEYGEPASGATEIEYTGFAGPTFYNVMTAVKLLNGLGDDLSFEAVDAALPRLHRPDDGPGRTDRVRASAVRRLVRPPDGNPAVRGRRMGIDRRRTQRSADRRDAAGRLTPVRARTHAHQRFTTYVKYGLLAAAGVVLVWVLAFENTRGRFVSGDGVAQGALVAAIALGVVLTFRGSGVVNFAERDDRDVRGVRVPPAPRRRRPLPAAAAEPAGAGRGGRALVPDGRLARPAGLADQDLARRADVVRGSARAVARVLRACSGWRSTS